LSSFARAFGFGWGYGGDDDLDFARFDLRGSR
jgi:hypothetical protein